MEVKPQMQDSSIQQVSPNSTALNAEHYQTFEMAKANDDVLANGTLKELINYQAQVRAMLEYTHKLVSTMSSWDEFTSSRAETLATEQAAANLNVFIDQRMGELVAALPKATGNQYQQGASLPAGNKAKGEVLKDAGLTPKTASQLEQLAKNPEVVEAVIAKAEEDGRVVSRSQVLKAIKERDEARKDAEEVSELYGKVIVQRDEAKEDLASERAKNLELGSQIASLRNQVSEKSEPEVIEREVEVVREVVPEDYEELKRENESLTREAERLNREYQDMWRKKRELDKKLDQANEMLGEKGRTREAQRDIEYLTMQVNKLLHQHGGKVWAFDQFYRVDETTQKEFEKAITSLAAFSQNLAQMISDRNKLEA